MKVISILGSPRGIKGYTGTLLQSVLEGAESAGAETEVFSLKDLSVLPCKGCLDVCHIKGACNQKDDFEKIRDAMVEADGIIYATPNYNLTVTAQLKALIDRCSLLLHCQRLAGKYVAIVITSGGSPPEDVERYLRSILQLYSYWIVGSIGVVEVQFQDPDEKTRIMESAKDLGVRLASAIKAKERFPDQEEDRNQSFEIMKYMVMMLKDRWPVAWDYWNTHWKVEE
jgi:multimeric flavodoxin WrbA